MTGVKAPAVLSYPAALRAIENLGLASAAAYDAVHDQIRGAQVGFVHNMVDWRPSDPSRSEDVTATAHADQIFNRAFIEIAVNGWYDTNANGSQDPGEVRPALAGKADFVGVNHYSPGRAQGLGAPVSPNVPLFDFLPQITYQGHGNPTGPPCPTTCSDFGWEIDPAGLRERRHGGRRYGKPVYVTENGIDDAEDDQRPNTCAATSAPSRTRSPRASTSADTSTGRCSTTTSGPRVTPRASASTATTRRR